MTTDQINDIRYALNVADIDNDKAWDALNALLAELDAARVNVTSLRQAKARVEAERDAAIDENIRLMNAETEALRAQLREARAREAKLREALKDVLPQAIHSRHCALRPCRCPIKTARAVLAEGEDTRD